MGYTSALGMREVVNDIRIELNWHLQYNHYPPVPGYMTELCIAAIESVNSGGWDDILDMPDGVLFRGSSTARAWQIIESLHLDAWVESDE